MLPGWQPCVIVATLYEGRDGPAVDLKIETQIPSEVRRPENDQMSTGLSARAHHRGRGNENENEKHSAEVISQASHKLIVARICSGSRRLFIICPRLQSKRNLLR
jgi:hypothetical protein